MKKLTDKTCKKVPNECKLVLRQLMAHCKGLDTPHGTVFVSAEIPRALYLKARKLSQ